MYKIPRRSNSIYSNAIARNTITITHTSEDEAARAATPEDEDGRRHHGRHTAAHAVTYAATTDTCVLLLLLYATRKISYCLAVTVKCSYSIFGHSRTPLCRRAAIGRTHGAHDGSGG
jgi:hypothetical protein